MEKPHGASFEDDSSDIKWEKGSTSGGDLSSCGSATGPTATMTTSVGGRIEEKMEVDDPLLLPSLASLPSSSSITITKASVAHQRLSQSPSSSSSSCTTTTHAPSSQSNSLSRTPSSTSSSDSTSSSNRGTLGPDMMPTIPLVPVQVPCGRSSIVTPPKIRGRPKGIPLSPSRAGSFQIRRGMKIKRIGLRGRGGRRLSHSMSLEERGGMIGEDSPLPLDDDAYVQDDMFMAPTYHDRWPGRICSLCCLGEQSQLGQGDLVRHEPTPSYTLPEKIASPSESSLQESLLSKKLKATQATLKDKGKSPRKQVGEILPEPVDEISLVGHSELPSISMLFEPSGHCYVHYMCALWSSNVELTNDDTITHVDRAVVAGASQRCAQCKKFGATLLCKAPGCQQYFHFPCAMSSGALMDLKSVALVCPSHTDKSRDIAVDVACVVCENLSPESSLLFCCSCGNHYHGLCLKPVISASPVTRAGWQCPDCKTCQMCRQPSEEMVCGVCDKAYHVVCARPFGLSLCKTGWKCKTCRVCGDCGSRTPGNGLSSRWHSNFTVCDSCYQLRNKGFACPICHKAYRAIAQKNMAMCTKCQRYVHNTCDADADLSIIQTKWNADHSYEYVCTSCSRVVPSPSQSPRATLEDSYDGPQDSSVHSDDSNDTDLTSEGKSEDISVKPQSSFFSRGKPLTLAKRGFPSKLRGGAGEKYSVGKKTFSGSKKRGQTMPVRRGRGNGRGYRGYFNYQNVTLQAMETNQSAGKEEGEENKLILVSAKDDFCLQQDVCAMCGAFGQDQEGRLIACAQCGQCYHPFCANVKVTKVVLQKGWRCLDCTVCEGCGERNDEARLVLCEDCDISYHIYCMNPPLDHVPSGVWRCKWCAMCVHCGATDPGINSTWQQNYSMCGPCMSMTQCPVCDEPYSDGELILQCSNCERWLHASDDMIHTEEEAERCASKGYLCLICRPQDVQPPHLLPQTPPVRSARIITTTAVTTTTSSSPVRSQSPTDIMTKVTSKAQFWVDGICLSECGMFQIKTMTLEPQKKSRNPKTVRTSRGPSIDSTGSRDIDDDDDDDDENKLDNEEPRHWVYGMKEGTILQAKEDGTPPDLPEGFYTLPGLEPGTYTLRKRRYRNIKTLGIGGFQVRARGKKDEEKAREEALLDPQVLELRRKRSNWRTKKKIKLLEKFPSYIQEAFFGRNLMDTSNLEEEMKQISGLDEELDEDVLEMQKAKSAITLSKDELQLVQAAQNKQQHGHDRLLDTTSLQDTKYIGPHQIKSEDAGDSKKRERKDTDDKKEKDHKEEDMAEEDENNEAIDAIFAQGGDITDIFMHDIISGSMKDDDANLTGDEDISQDTIDIPSGNGNGTKLTDILGPGFNLDDVADIMKNLPEDGAEDSQDSTLSTTIPPASTVGTVEGEGSACADSETSVSSTPTESPATQTSSNLSISKESTVVPTSSGPITLPAASTLRPNQPPVAPLGSLPVSGSVPAVPAVQTIPGISPVPLSTPVPLGNTIQGPSPITSIKSPATMPSPVGHTSPATHQSPSTLPSPLPSPATAVPAASQSLSSPLSRPDSQASSHGFCSTPTPFSSTSKPSTPTIPETQKLWSSNDSQSQSLSLEEDESLGDKATKAAVLYVNVHKPNLKTDFPAVADRERQIRRIWKNLKDTEQKKILIQRARENKKEYYKNKQEQQRALKSSENLETSEIAGTTSTSSNVNEGGNTDPSPVTTPHASPRPPLPSLTPPRPMVITQRPQIPSGTPVRQIVPHSIIRGPHNPIQGGVSDTYAMPSGTSLPSKSVDSFTHPSTPTPQTSPLPSPNSDLYSRVPPSPRPQSSDLYSLPPGTPRPIATDPYAMPPPTPRPVDPYSAQPPTPRPITSEQFTCSTPTESFSQSPASPYVQAPPTPRPHDDIYGQPPTASPSGGGVPGDPARQQHLRELLQRPSWSEGGGAHQSVITPPMTSPTGLPGEFRPPLPPTAPGQNVRMKPNMAPGQQTMMVPQGGQMDHRFRMIFQRSLQQPSRQGVVNGRSSVEAFTHMSQQRPPQQYLNAAGPGIRPGVTSVVRGPATTVIVSQGMGSPHLPPGSAVRVPVVSPTHLPQPPAHQLVPTPHPSSANPQPHHPPLPQSPSLQQSHAQSTHSQQSHLSQDDSQLPHPQLPQTQQSHPQQSPHAQPSHPQPPHSEPPHSQAPHSQPPPPPLAHQQEAQPPQQQQSESELPEAVTRELEQLEEEQQQHHHRQHPPPQPPSQPVAASQPSAQGDDLEDLAPGDLTTMEDDDLLGMGGDFNALLEFADGEDGEEDNEKLPSNLFDDLDADEEERRKKEKGREIVSGVRGPPKGKVGVSSISSPSSGPLSHSQPTVAPSHGPQHHTTGSVTLDCDAQSQDPHQESVMTSTVQQRPGLPHGPAIGPVRLSMSTSPQQQPMQPQMAPQITQATPRIGGTVTRMLGPRPGIHRHPAPPPPPYPGHPPPPYPRSQEQPLLIEDLLEQEKQEQMKQQKASHQQESIGPVDLNLSDMDYEKLKADVLAVGNPQVGLPTMPGGQVLSNNGSVRQPFQRVVGPPPTASSQSPHQVSGPAQPLTRPVRPQGDPGMHPGPHPSPGESPFSPQTRMPSPGGGYPDQGPRAAYTGAPQGITHHMMAPQMRVRMPVHSPGTQTVQPSQMSPHMIGVRSPYPQAGVMIPQSQGAPMLMRHQYPQGVMPLRRPSGSGPVPSPGSSGPVPSPSGPVQSPVGGGMAMKPSPVHSGLKSPVPLASPSPGGPVASPISGTTAMKPSPVNSGLKSPVPLSSPQMRPLSAENPSTPLTPRSISAGEIVGTPQTPHSDFGGPGSNSSQVNSPHPSVPTPTSDPVPSPVSSSASLAPASGQRSGGGGGNCSNPNNPAPLPPYISRFGFFKFGLKGGALLRSRWGHFKLGLKGGAPVGDLENKTPTSCPESATSAPVNTTVMITTSSSTLVTCAPSHIKSEIEGDDGQEGLAHVLSESVKGPVVRMLAGTPRVGQVAYSSPGIATTPMPPHLSASANKLVVPEPAKSEIPPSSRHQAVIGIPGGGAIPSQNNMYPSHTVAVAPGIRIPSINASANYPSSTTGAGNAITTSTNVLSLPIGTSGAGNIGGNLVPPSIMSVTSSATSASSTYTSNVVPVGLPPDDVSTHSTIVSISDQVSGITSGLANYASTSSLPLSSVPAMTHTTPSLGRPLVSVPVQQIGSPQRHVLQNPVTVTTTHQLRTLPSIGHLQPGTRPFRTQLMRAPVSQHGVQDSEGHQAVTQQQVMHPTLTQTVGMLTNNVHQPVGQQAWIQTSSGTLHQGGVVLQGGVQQAVGVRMVAQPMMVQQTIVRGSNVMVRPGTSGPVAVQGGVRMMMIHGGQPVRTPSPPITRPAMMPPPAAKSPAGHSASPVSRVSPAPSPLSNHTSPHSPQIKSQSPSLTSVPSPHSTIPTPPNLIKREPEDDSPGSCSTPNITHPIPVATSTPQALGTQHMIVTSVSLQPQLSLLNNPQVTSQTSSGASGQIKTEINDGMSKESSNALLKQLLENTGCASPMQQPSQGQLLLFRSSQGHLPMQSSHLSQVASQVPNPTPIVIPRSAVSSSGPVSLASVQQTTSTPTLMSQNKDIQQQSQQLQQQQQQQCQPQLQSQPQHGVITPGSQPQPSGSSPHMMQRSVVVSSGIHPSQGTHTVILGQQQQLVSHSTAHVNLGHSVVRQGVPFSGQGHPVQYTTAPHPSSQQAVVRQVTTHQINHPSVIPSSTHHVIQGQPPQQTATVSPSSRPLGGHLVTPTSPHMVVHAGVRATHPGQQHALSNAHQPGTHVVTGTRAPLNSTVMNTTSASSSIADRVNSDPTLKTEMRVMIPETVMGTGAASTGEHTPEMTTPNDGSDSMDHEELKKAKKRAQQARRKSQSKDTKVQPAKRARQGSRVEEDYDAYIESVMQQLRAMPPLNIMEPEVPRNFNLCPVFGSGDLSKLGRRDCNHRQGILEGTLGNATIKNVTDYYNTQPFGDKMPIVTPAKTGPTQRGFYIHEFTPPKIGLPLDEYQEGDLVSGSGRPTPAPTPTREADSPDTVLSSSSPECILPESPLPFKGLRLVDMDEDPQEDQRDRSLSPAIPLLIPTPIRPGQLPFLSAKSKDNPELDKENIGSLSSITLKSRVGQSPALPLKDMGNVTVTLTLSSQAGEDVSGVLRSLANLLNIPPPSAYHMADRLEAPKISRLYRHKQLKDGKEQVVDIQSILNGQARFCCNCDMIILKDILCKKVLELPFLSKEEYGNIEEITFCSHQCYIQFAVTQRMLMDEKGKHEGPSRHIKLKDSFGDVKGSVISSAEALSDWSKEDDMDEVLKVPQLEDSLMSRPNKHKLDDHNQYPKQADGKRFRGHKYKYWSPTALPLPENYEKPTPKEMTDLLFRMGITYRKSRIPDDSRQCILCNLYGDYVADGPSRLLNYDVDKWVHLNCALWAEDVYETMNGALMNVETAMKKVASSECEHCQQLGASVKCFKVRCSKVYHLNCAVKEGCTFYKNKTVYCQEHINKGEKDNELSTLAVFRRVFIDRDENRQVASVMHHADLSYVLRIGSLILLAIGQLLPHQLQAFHTPYCIYPVGYQVIRYYWSMRRLHKRCAYECSIHDKDGQPEFRIIVREDGYEDRVFISCSPKGVWTKVLEPLAELRQKADVVRLFPQYISGEDLFGLTEPAIVRILESLPGIDTLADYNFKFGRNPLFELPLAVNPSGCARAEPFTKLHLKRYHGIRTSAGSVRTSSNCRAAASVANLTMAYDPFVPYSKLHVHSRSSQYKKMNNEWRSSVYLARSKIQGLGLYAARDIEKNTMIIEYIGEIIRSELAEVREKRYEAQNRGIYMFRLDDQRVVDATVTGGLARYINHSCGPNCYTETIEVERDMKILIISNRKILRGEELAYDYKFDEEEDHKIPCLCGAENCRKWMN